MAGLRKAASRAIGERRVRGWNPKWWSRARSSTPGLSRRRPESDMTRLVLQVAPRGGPKTW